MAPSTSTEPALLVDVLPGTSGSTIIDRDPDGGAVVTVVDDTGSGRTVLSEQAVWALIGVLLETVDGPPVDVLVDTRARP